MTINPNSINITAQKRTKIKALLTAIACNESNLKFADRLPDRTVARYHKEIEYDWSEIQALVQEINELEGVEAQ